MNILKPQAPAKNEAVALQKRANARPIPTYKDGGKVDDARISARMAAGNYKKGGKLTKKADGGVMDQYSGMPAPLQQPVAAADAYDGSSYGSGPKPLQPMVSNPNMPAPAYKKGGKVMKKDGLAVMIAIGKPMKGMKKPVKKAVGGTAAPAQMGATGRALLTPAAVAAAKARMAKTPAQLTAEREAQRTAARTKLAANKAKNEAGAARTAAILQRGKDASAKAKAVLANPFLTKQREINTMKAANAASMARSNQTRAANATARAANQARQVQLNQQKAANDAAIAAKTPVKKAVGGVGKVRKGMMKGK
jgi:hypothetical protein